MKAKSLVRKGNRRAAEAELRLATVMAVARKLFLKRGYADTSLNDVVAAAGGSKATLQKYFGNKAGLFAAVVGHVSKRFVETTHIGDLQGTPAEVLTKYGTAVLRFYLQRDALTCYRGVVAEGNVKLAMAEAFYYEGHARNVVALAERLELWRSQGLIHKANCAEDADMFLHMLRAGLYEQTLIGLRKAARSRDIAAHVDHVVRVFLHGVESPPVPSRQAMPAR